MSFKRVLLSVFFFLFFFAFNVSAKEKPQVVFINQVRGEECCSIGSLENLKIQIDAFEKHQIPSFFALRYDALTNKEFILYLKEQIKSHPEIINLGILLEITPQLARDSGVRYNGSVERWFEAQNVFTIGYQKKDRKKIIDLLFRTFKDNFGFYPVFTSSWLIDTDSLNYMQENYGLIAHQITREQWGVDSYTLYGGPPHYPYPASKNWAFIPDFKEKNPILIVRQTVSDPLYNYGETKKHFTSQPNDYLNSGLDFEYFKKLIYQALFNQKTTGFALLGLENANEKKYQDEFVKQIEYVDELRNRVAFPDLKQLTGFWKRQKTTTYIGRDLINGTNTKVEFITADEYRIRKIYKDRNTYITDYRYFGPDFADPYIDYAAKKDGYWIVPYALDYSRVYKPDSIFPRMRNDFSISGQPDYKIIKIDPKKFSESRLKNYPYFLPEAIEREIDRKSKVKVTVGSTIEIELKAVDRFGYPANISYPVELITEPRVKEVGYFPDSAKHIFLIPNKNFNFQKISLTSNKKIIKEIYLFPLLFPFIKIAF